MGNCWCRICADYIDSVCEACGSHSSSGLYRCSACGGKMKCPKCQNNSFELFAPYNPNIKK